MMKMSKRLLSIVLTGIMVTSLFTGIALGVNSTNLVGDSKAHINNTNDTYPVLIGQTLTFEAIGETIYGQTPDSIEGMVFGSTSTDYDTASYFSVSGVYNFTNGSVSTKLAVESPMMTLTTKAKQGSTIKTVSSVTQGTDLLLKLSGNWMSDDCVDIVINGPSGRIHDDSTNYAEYTTRGLPTTTGGCFDNLSLSNAKKVFGNTSGTGQGINTTGWTIGTYTIKVATKSENARGLDAETATSTVIIKKSEIDISAEKTSAIVGETVKLTVTGPVNHAIEISGTAGDANIAFPSGIEDNRAYDTATGKMTTLQIDADGARTFAVEFADTGSYTLTVTDIITGANVTDTISISVSDKEVTFDTVNTVVIGDKFDVKGTVNEGTYVCIAYDDAVIYRITVDENKEFLKEVDTSASGTNSAFKVPGSLRLEAYINDTLIVGSSTIGITSDGTHTVLMTVGSLSAELSTSNVALGDDFKVSGTAPGTQTVDILTVGTKGGSGGGIDASGSGVNYYGASVSDDDNSFEKKITVASTAKSGTYLVGVLSAGRDGVYGQTNEASIFSALAVYLNLGNAGNVAGFLALKSQDDILAILAGLTGDAGSDDLVLVLPLIAEEQKLEIDAPIGDVAIGDDLVVTGTSNRKADMAIVVTCKGPLELTPVTVYPSGGVWEATFDTSSAEVGVYTVKADDGDRTVTETVNIVTETVPTVTATAEPTEVVPTDVPTVEPTTEPTTEPTEEPTPTPPGFEAIFALAGLFAVAFLVARRRE